MRDNNIIDLQTARELHELHNLSKNDEFTNELLHNLYSMINLISNKWNNMQIKHTENNKAWIKSYILLLSECLK